MSPKGTPRGAGGRTTARGFAGRPGKGTRRMKLGTALVDRAAAHHRIVLLATAAVTLAAALLAGLPSVWPRTFAPLHPVRVDTDPENMLAEDEPVRVFHDRMKARFSLNDMVVVGVVNTKHDSGVFNPKSLGRVYELTEFAKTLRWPGESGETEGVILRDIIAPSTVDNIEPGERGEIRFNWMMPEPPATQAEADAILADCRRIPFLEGTMISTADEGDDAVAVYLPITSKDLSYRIYDALNERIPVLWLWGPLRADIAAAYPQQARGLERLGRLAAQQVEDAEEFREFFTMWSEELAAGNYDANTWQRVKEIAEEWRPAAEKLDAERQAEVAELTAERNEHVRAAVEAAKRAGAGDLPELLAGPGDSKWDENAREAVSSAMERLRRRGDAGREAADELAEAVDVDDELGGYLVRASRKASEQLREHLLNAAWDTDTLLRLARYHVASQAGTVQTGTELIESVKSFADECAGLLPASGQPFKGLPGTVRNSFAANADVPGDDQVHITGLPVAEDTFGVEMFIQMAISAPAAMAVIFLLMLAFFRKLVLILSPLLLALVTVVITMSVLIISGFPVHIMSSMIPIFIMPIAVLDSVHIISEFFERYQRSRNRRETIRSVIDALFMPMLYTSLTSSAGFASLALTPIPPVQVFGLFVAMGVMLAWGLTMTFIPAFVMLIPERTLENFGTAVHDGADDAGEKTRLGRVLKALGGATYRRAKPILAVAAAVMVLAGYGVTQIRINDNPIKWFTKGHAIRVADRQLNRELGGTYMAYLSLEATERAFEPQAAADAFANAAEKQADELKEMLPAAEDVFVELTSVAREEAQAAGTREAFYSALSSAVSERREHAEGERSFAWDEAATFVELQQQQRELFKRPEVLEFMLELQRTLESVEQDGRPLVGKSNSLADIVRTVHRDLRGGEQEQMRIPGNRRMVAECLFQYQQSHRPHDLWHFATQDYRSASIWVQLNSGDNKDMTKVTNALNEHLQKVREAHADEPDHPANRLSAEWFGLTYINVVWQQKMVTGMLLAFAGSFLVVFLLMTVLFRSALWGLLSMVPLTVTIAAIYGAVGLIGKDYDMPVAVLSALTLGLAVDFAIHFLARGRAMERRLGSWEAAAPAVFGEPARAIARNIIVIAAGFLPLLAAPLVPYKTVGTLMATILLVSGVATLLLLPALVRVLRRWLFVRHEAMGPTCNCATCIATAAALVAAIALAVSSYLHIHWTKLTWVSLAAVPLLALLCGITSRRERCKMESERSQEEAT
jgi:hypothetical protein